MEVVTEVETAVQLAQTISPDVVVMEYDGKTVAHIPHVLPAEERAGRMRR